MRTPSSDVFIGRQPVLDRQRRVIAYELLFRASQGDLGAHVSDDALSSARLIAHAFRELGIDTVVGRALAFVNLDAELIMSPMIETLPNDQVVLELLETVSIDDRIVRRCHDLKRRGYRLALDDFFRYSEAYEPLLEVVDIVKVDVLMLDADSLADLVRCLKPWRTRLLAEKVDTGKRARDCLALGFDLFQGFYFGRPAIVG